MRLHIDVETRNLLCRLSDDDCRELSRLCGRIFDAGECPEATLR